MDQGAKRVPLSTVFIQSNPFFPVYSQAMSS